MTPADDRDLQEIANQVRRVITDQAASLMPQPVILQVIDTSVRHSNGWVLCNHAGRQVRCMMPNSYDTEVGAVVIALPPNDPTEPYWAFGALAANTLGGGYTPSLVTPSINIPPVTTAPPPPTSGATIYIDESTETITYINVMGGTASVAYDGNAIHDNVSGEISALTEKGSPVSGDWLMIEDSEAGDVKKKLQVGSLPSSGGGSNPLLLTGTAGENLSQSDHVYLNPADNEWYQVNVTATPPGVSFQRGVVTESGGIASSSTGEIQVGGECAEFSSLTPGGRVWASDSAAAGVTQTKPSLNIGDGQVVLVPVGIATAADTVLLSAQADMVITNYVALADEAAATLQHPSNALERDRQAWATVSAPTYGSDQTGTATATASSESSASFNAPKASDNNTSTYWQSAVDPDTTPQWWEADWSGSNKTIRKLRMHVNNFASNGPQDFELQYWDGASWATALSVTGASWSPPEWKEWELDTDYTSDEWRIYITADNGAGTVIVWEVEMMEISSYGDRRPAIVGPWDDSTPDIAIRYGDTGGSDADTKTSFDNKTGGFIVASVFVRLGLTS